MPDGAYQPYTPDVEFVERQWSSLRWKETIEDLLREPSRIENFGLADLTGIAGDLSFELGSMQLEGLLYFNLLEQAKNDQSEDVVSRIKELGRELGLRSVNKPTSEGGPPNPFHLGLVDWLLKKITAIARAMHQLALRLLPRLLGAIQDHLKISDLAFSVGLVLSFPPGVTFDFEPPKLNLDVAALLNTMLDRFYAGEALLPEVPVP
jgi:hypothetical protein